jgi:RHS repeat-associated protein
MNARRLAAAALTVLFLTMGTAIAQEGQGTTPLGHTPGTPAGAYSLTDLDHVNLFGGSLSFRLPLLATGGRGEAGTRSFLVVETHWGLAANQFGQYTPRFNWWRGIEPGYGPGALRIYRDTDGLPTNRRYTTRMTFTTSDQTQYELRDKFSEGQQAGTGFNRGREFKSFDGSLLTFVSDTNVVEPASGDPSGRLMFPNGLEYRIDGGVVTRIRDRNGNVVRLTYGTGFYRVGPQVATITDALNRQVTFTYATPSSPTDVIRFRGFGGAFREVRINYTLLQGALTPGSSVQTLGQLFPDIQWLDPQQPHNPRVAASVVLPNGRSYTLRYNSYGELAHAELPTGGLFLYAYVPGGTGESFISRRVSQKSTYAGNAEVMRTTFSVDDSVANQVTTVRHFDPAAPSAALSTEHHYFYGRASDNLFEPPAHFWPHWQTGKEFRTEILDGGLAVKKAVEHTWQQLSGVPWDPPPFIVTHDPRIVETRTILDGAVTARTTFQHDVIEGHWFNVTDVREFGFDGALIRRKHTDFEYAAVYFKDDIHLRRLPLRETLYEGENQRRAETLYEYDNYAAGLAPRGNLTGRVATNPDPYGTAFIRRGNATAVRRWLDTTNTYLTTVQDYDITGNVVRETNPRGHATQFFFDDRFGGPDGNARVPTRPAELPPPLETFAFATSSVNPLAHTTFVQRDYYTSQPVDQEDVNGVVSSAWFEDPLDRVTRVVNANSDHDLRSRTAYEYVDDQRLVITRADKDTFQDIAIRSELRYDQLGRESERRQIEPGGGYIAVQREYDAKGRPLRVSNPFRPLLEDPVWTEHAYDALDRMEQTTAPGNAITTTTYAANTATVTDPAGKSRRTVTDALGRVAQVFEDPSGLNHQTTYQYDVLDNLARVVMGGQIRQFTHDSLSRLITSINPESGTIGYLYDPNGNLERRTDARGIVTTYGYDELDRARTIAYTNEPAGSHTPDVTNTYDDAAVPFAKGRLIRVQSSSSTTDILQYDANGRVLASRQTTDGQAYGMHYTYDLAGNLRTQTYPSGRVVTTTFDRAVRVEAVTSQPFQGTLRSYADLTRYSPHGGLFAVRLGNGRWDLTNYNDLLQPRFMGLNSGDSTENSRDVVQIENRYGGAQNNGNVREQWITAPGFAKTQLFGYDALNRLETAGETGSWSQTYTYDRFGNRAVTGTLIDPGQSPQSLSHFSTANNRLTTAFNPNIAYDASGNLTRDTRGWTYAYDAENHQLTANTAGGTSTYEYDGQGRRVRRVHGPTSTTFVYDTFGKLIADYGGPGPTGTSFITTDHLGTTRLVTDEHGAVRSRHDHFPFGEEIPSSIGGRSAVFGYGANGGVRQKFTGQERDAETGLDFFQARYFSGPQGRFTSVDPLFNLVPTTGDPQRWNRYAYVRGNPLRHVDPDGEDVGEAAAWVQGKVHAANEFVISQSANNLPPLEAAQMTFLSEATSRVVIGFADMFRVGESTGAALGRGDTGLAFAAAVSEDAGRAGGLALLFAPVPKTIGIGPAGKIGEARFVADLEASGGKVLGQKIGVRTSDGLTVPDFYVQRRPGAAPGFVEVKTGQSPLTEAQEAGFPLIRSEGGTIMPSRGRAAQAGLTPGGQIGPTAVTVVRYPAPRPLGPPRPLWVPRGHEKKEQ